MSRRLTSLLVSGALLVLLAGIAALLPVPYVSLEPGPTFNTLGEYNDQPVIEITGAKTYPTNGALNLVTVGERGGPYGRVTLFEAFRGWISPSVAVLPERLLYPESETNEDVEQENVASMKESQSSATTAALRYLGKPVTEVVVVSSVVEGAPADGHLKPADEIVTVNGVKATDATSAVEVVSKVKPGDTVKFVVNRKGVTTNVNVVAGKNPQTPTKPYLGITVALDSQSPIKVDYTLEDVGGPSAGLMFSLGVIDKLTPLSLTQGKHFAGTGTMTDDGKVGPIGGVQQKVVGAKRDGATIFLTPSANCADAYASKPDGLMLVKVDTLSQAVDAIKAIDAGKPVTQCTAA